MDTYNFYNKVAVTVACNRNRGSGCLYQPDSEEYSYILTAKHCLTGKIGEESEFEINNIVVTGSQELNGGVQIKVLDYLLHEHLDIAIIIVEYIPTIPRYLIANPNREYTVTMNGYPNYMSGERKSIKCSVHEWSQTKPDFEVLVTDGQLISYGNNETNLVEGFSGSGVFNEINEDYYLIGIFPGFKADSGAYHSLEVIKAEEFNTLLEDADIALLMPNYLASFTEHLEPAFDSRSEFIAMILRQKAEEILTITPLSIKTLFNDKLVLPYGKVNLNDKNMWIGWITLLTYLHIESGNSELQSLLRRENRGQQQDVKFFYVYNQKRLEDLFKLIIHDKEIYNDIGPSDCIVINHEGKTGEVVKLSETKMSKIIKDIGVPRLRYIHNVHKVPNIDQHTISKDITLIHVDCFIDEFKKLIDIEDFVELEEQLTSSIKGVLNNE